LNENETLVFCSAQSRFKEETVNGSSQGPSLTGAYCP